MADLFLGRPRSRRYPKFNIRRDIPLWRAQPSRAWRRVSVFGHNGGAQPGLFRTCTTARSRVATLDGGSTPRELTLHADRGSSMQSKPVALLLADLGVTKTHSRPHVSNDNPYSESQFKTLKYCPQFPQRFGSIEDARLFCRNFFGYYNHEHRHSGIGLMTPAVVHHGRAEKLTTARRQTLVQAQRAHPERFVRGTPQPPVLPPQAWINPPPEKTTHQEAETATCSGWSIPELPRRV